MPVAALFIAPSVVFSLPRPPLPPTFLSFPNSKKPQVVIMDDLLSDSVLLKRRGDST